MEEMGLPTIGAFAAKLSHRDGLVPLYLDADTARAYARLGPEAQSHDGLQLLYYSGLSTGLGANPVGVDRGSLGDTFVLALNRVGGSVLFEALNFRQRASSADPLEARAAREGFPRSVIGSAPIVARDADGSLLVDITDFLVRDATDIAPHFKKRHEGDFSLDTERSGFDATSALNFPDNTELEALITLTSDEPGRWAGSTAPDGGALTFRVHHSFVRLPDDGYRPRRASARMGHFSTDHLDFSAPIEKPLEQRLAVRHRLSKDEPLVYYIDPGTPEPIRSALVEGASWWSEAFAAAGFPDGFEVRLLPADAHPLDVRYNVVNWVHRTTRGWSYGASVVDPRTGEIIKGHVTLGSQRIRQDRRIFEALLGSAGSGKGGTDDPVELALARIRQLAAHEVGHTLGFEHNFAASTYERASVMDYPAPLITMVDAKPSFSEAYATGIGIWDRTAFKYLYQEWQDPESESTGLAQIMTAADASGAIHLSDAETHSRGASHPDANVWDNGADARAHLLQLLAVREWGLSHFDGTRLAQGAETRDLELTFGPLYFMHRYQLAAVGKLLGGERYALGPAPARPMRPVAPNAQREALDSLLGCLSGAVLRVPVEARKLLIHIDQLDSWSGPNFDPIANAAAAARLVVDELLQAQRAHRMNLHHRARDASPDFKYLLAALIDQACSRSTQQVVAEGLMQLASDADAPPMVRGQAESALSDYAARLRRLAGRASSGSSQAGLAKEIERWLERPYTPRSPTPVHADAPPGSPIGAAQGCGFD
jgi:hypothetical protein